MTPAAPFAVTDAPRETLLRTYLSDHLAGAQGGLALARRCRDNNGANRFGEALAALVPEIERDRDALRDLMRALRAPGSRMKQAAATVAERLGRLKLNGQVVGYSDLSRLVELEAICAGVETKRNLWQALRITLSAEEVPESVDLQALLERAERQRDVLEELRLAAARMAMGG